MLFCHASTSNIDDDARKTLLSICLIFLLFILILMVLFVTYWLKHLHESLSYTITGGAAHRESEAENQPRTQGLYLRTALWKRSWLELVTWLFKKSLLSGVGKVSNYMLPHTSDTFQMQGTRYNCYERQYRLFVI